MNYKKVLILTDCLYPVPSANGIITKNIMKEMIKREYDITCISINQDISYPINDNYKIYNVDRTKFSKLVVKKNNLSLMNKLNLKLFTIIRKINNLMNINKFPDVDPNQSNQVFDLAKKLHDKEKFHTIIGVFRPYSSVAAMRKMKKLFPELICVAIYLDILSGGIKPSFLPKILYNKLCIKGDIKTFEELDLILMAEKGRNIYNEDIYRKIISKLIYINFPVFVEMNNIETMNFDKKDINLVYAGTLNKDYRNPLSMLRAINRLSKDNKITLHLFGRNNCTHIIQKFGKTENFKIVEYGLMEHDFVQKAFNSADFLINISNKTDNIIPSKIFEIFAFGKPVINFNSREDDGLKEYSLKYPSIFRLPEEFSESEIVNLNKFIKQERFKKYNYEDLKTKFIENTPEYFVDIFEKEILKVLNRCGDEEYVQR